MPNLKRLEFVKSAAGIGDLPHDSQAEVAIAGRSNAGKSSALNTLAHRKRLAYVSKTPGRTQELNYFRVAEGRYLVDLPGYGYAQVPAAIRGRWEKFLGEYLLGRQALQGLVLVMDARHPLTEIDQFMLRWFAASAKPVHVLLTKSDKLNRGTAARTLQAVRRFLTENYPRHTVQLFSSTEKTGLDEAEEVILCWLGLAPATGIKNPRLKGSKTGGEKP